MMSQNQHGSTSTSHSTTLTGEEGVIILGFIKAASEIKSNNPESQKVRKYLESLVLKIQRESDGNNRIENQLHSPSVEELKTRVRKISDYFTAIRKSLQETSLAGEADVLFKISIMDRLATQVILPTFLLGQHKEYNQVDEETRKKFYQTVVKQSHHLQCGLVKNFLETVEYTYGKEKK